MQIEMHNILTHMTRFGHAHERVRVGHHQNRHVSVSTLGDFFGM